MVFNVWTHKHDTHEQALFDVLSAAGSFELFFATVHCRNLDQNSGFGRLIFF